MIDVDDGCLQWWKCGSARCCLASSLARKLRWTIVIIIVSQQDIGWMQIYCITASSSSPLYKHHHNWSGVPSMEGNASWNESSSQPKVLAQVHSSSIVVIMYASTSFASYYDVDHYHLHHIMMIIMILIFSIAGGSNDAVRTEQGCGNILIVNDDDF